LSEEQLRARPAAAVRRIVHADKRYAIADLS
jgi:hypothetical protein